VIRHNLERLQRFYSYLRTRLAFRHISGPTFFELGEEEVVCVILGKDIEYYLPYLIAWHQGLGVGKFIYVDNASTDRSLDIAAEHENIIAVRCTAPYKAYQRHIRYYGASLFCRGGWRLVVDADELFDYPGSDRMPIEALTARLNRTGQTAVVSQMLDMVPRESLTALGPLGFEDSVARFCWYDLSAVQKLDYHDDNIYDLSWFFQKNEITNEDIKVYTGGIRGLHFGERCLLTKHPLYKPGPGVMPFHPHVTSGVRCAEFSGVLRHYKFAGDFIARETERVEKDNMYTHNEAELRVDKFTRDPDFKLYRDSCAQYGAVVDLLDNGFLVMSDTMRADLDL
jgi:glycosyltransferase involved in cell wall biosynthesis